MMMAAALVLLLLSMMFPLFTSKFMQRSDIKKSMHYISRQINNNNNKYQKINIREPPINNNLYQLPATDNNNNVDIFVRRKDIGLWQKYDETLVEDGQVENALRDMFYAINNVNSFNNNVIMKKNLFDKIILKMPNMKKIKIKDIDVGYKLRAASTSSDSTVQNNSAIVLLRINTSNSSAANNDSSNGLVSIDKIDMKRFAPRQPAAKNTTGFEAGYSRLHQKVSSFLAAYLKDETGGGQGARNSLTLALFSDGSLLKRNNQIMLASGGIVVYPFTSFSSADTVHDRAQERSGISSDDSGGRLVENSFQLHLADIAGVASTPYDAEAATAIGTFVLAYIFQQSIDDMSKKDVASRGFALDEIDIEYYCDSKKLVKDIKNMYKRMYKDLPLKADDPSHDYTDYSLLYYLEAIISVLSQRTVYVPNKIAAGADSSSDDAEPVATMHSGSNGRSSVRINWIAGSPPSDDGKKTRLPPLTYREKGIYLADSLSRNNKKKNRFAEGDSDLALAHVAAEVESREGASMSFIELMDICSYILSLNC